MLKWSVTSLGSSENGYGILSPEHCRIQREPMTVLMLEQGEEVFLALCTRQMLFCRHTPSVQYLQPSVQMGRWGFLNPIVS